MASFSKNCINIIEIDSQYKDTSSTNSCDCGKYSSKVNNCFFNFPDILGSLPAGSIISSATLYLSQVSGGFSTSQNIVVSLHSGNWYAPSWNNQPTKLASNSQTAVSGSGAATQSFNVTSLIQWLSNNRSSAHIFKLERASNENSGNTDAKRFSTSAGNHSLSITYTAPTAPTAPSGLSISANAFESACRLSWTKGENGSNNPITKYALCLYKRTDGVNWDELILADLAPSATYYDIPTATLNALPRGMALVYRVDSHSAYSNIVFSSYSGAFYKNSAPNAIVGVPTTNKNIFAPGEAITITFAPPTVRDPDANRQGDVSGYEVKMQDETGADYNAAQIMGSNASATATTVMVSTTGWVSGKQWRFLVRAYDSYGVKSNWSAATDYVSIGTPLKVIVGGAVKSIAEQQVLVGGSLKQVSEIKVLVGGVLKDLTT